MDLLNIECQLTQAQMARYLAGENLPADTVKQLERHLAECANCRDAAEAKKQDLELAAQSPSTPAPEPTPEITPTATQAQPEPAAAAESSGGNLSDDDIAALFNQMEPEPVGVVAESPPEPETEPIVEDLPIPSTSDSISDDDIANLISEMHEAEAASASAAQEASPAESPTPATPASSQPVSSTAAEKPKQAEPTSAPSRPMDLGGPSPRDLSEEDLDNIFAELASGPSQFLSKPEEPKASPLDDLQPAEDILSPDELEALISGSSDPEEARAAKASEDPPPAPVPSPSPADSAISDPKPSEEDTEAEEVPAKMSFLTALKTLPLPVVIKQNAKMIALAGGLAVVLATMSFMMKGGGGITGDKVLKPGETLEAEKASSEHAKEDSKPEKAQANHGETKPSKAQEEEPIDASGEDWSSENPERDHNEATHATKEEFVVATGDGSVTKHEYSNGKPATSANKKALRPAQPKTRTKRVNRSPQKHKASSEKPAGGTKKLSGSGVTVHDEHGAGSSVKVYD
ncbi:MAG: zf-HC2 domain-containing protein [Armatimonadetes bacterium]|nr:zf-HC2 domain-containing protein [Armatimonadota bacterium]